MSQRPVIHQIMNTRVWMPPCLFHVFYVEKLKCEASWCVSVTLTCQRHVRFTCLVQPSSPHRISLRHVCLRLCVFQRQQVVMTEQLAKTHTNVHFSVMHPGWVDTPGTACSHICTTLRVKSNHFLDKFNKIILYSKEASLILPPNTSNLWFSPSLRLSVCLSQRWPMPCQTSIGLWRTVFGPQSRGLTLWFGWLSLRLQPQTPADVSTRVCCKTEEIFVVFIHPLIS